jgi:PKD repeat protein
MNVTDTATHIYGDNGVFTVTLSVTDDDGGVTIYTTPVTVTNVAPTLTNITLTLPYPDNPDFILPRVHTLEFYATATDPGSDDLIFTWNWGDSTSDTTTIYYNNGTNPDPYPSPDINPMNITDTQYHIYDQPGNYTITLTVADDDGGMALTTYNIIILDAEGAKHDINDYIQDLPDNVFKGKADKRKNAFTNMFNALDDMLDDEEYWGMIEHLNNNIRTKCDGSQGGKKNDDWIKGNTPQGEYIQWHICSKIDDLTAYLTTFL